MNERLKELAEQAGFGIAGDPEYIYAIDYDGICTDELEKFFELIVKECINKIETHQIPVGNSAAGEMACEWTYAALKEIRHDIKEHFGVEE